MFYLPSGWAFDSGKKHNRISVVHERRQFWDPILKGFMWKYIFAFIFSFKTFMLHAHVGISLTYLLPGGSPKQINESTASTPLCKFTVLVCPSFCTCHPASSEWQIYKQSVTCHYVCPAHVHTPQPENWSISFYL